jgi:ribosomal protein S18 acetylase RimI-like enzyme
MAQLLIRSATTRDLPACRLLLAECIENSIFYTEDFKRRELARLNPTYLRDVLAIDPNFIRLAEWQGRTVGILLLLPEAAVVWSSWLYVRPERNAAAAALLLFRTTWKLFDGTAFDKVCCYVRPENAVALAMFERMGFRRTAELQKHLFGQDVWLLEKPFANATGRYDELPTIGPARKIWNRIAAALGL